MTTHRAHPVFGARDGLVYADPDDALLFDRCDRCAQQAANPLALDTSRIEELWRRMIDVERGDGPDHYLTSVEAHACRYLYGVGVLIERLSRVNPWTVPWTVDGIEVGVSKTVYAAVVDAPWRDDDRDRKAQP